MFDMLTALHEKYKKEEVIIPVEEPKNAVDKTNDVKQYKRNYYLHNLQIYKERNKAYREKKKEEKKKLVATVSAVI
jgi:hypothetical protein